MSKGSKEFKLMNRDIDDWTITFADTGLHSNIGQRLIAIKKYIEDEEVFLANYADGLTDLHLPNLIDQFKARNKVASFVSVKAKQSFHLVSIKNEDEVSKIQHLTQSGIWINGGFFVFKSDIFNYIKNSEELVEEPFQRLIAGNQLITYKYEGFWVAMDTFKDKQHLDEIYAKGNAPWEIWKNQR